MSKNGQNQLDQTTDIKTLCNGDDSFAGSMFRHWKTEFSNISDKFTEEISKDLTKALNFTFNNDLHKWRDYIAKVKECRFIKDNPHFLNLKWVLQEKTIKEISSGKNNFSKWLLEKRGNLDARERENMFEAINHIKSLHYNKSESETCIKGRIWILQNLGPMRYHSWFHTIGLTYEGGDRLTYHGSNFMTDMTLQRYGDSLNTLQYQGVDIKHFLDTAADF